MKALFPLLSAAVLLAAASSRLGAQEPDKAPTPAVKPGNAAADEVKKGPESGKLVILRSGHVMEGEVKRTDTQICIRKDKSEVWISCDRALRICPDWDDAYLYLKSQIDLKDAGARVRLARWCFANHLFDRAMDEVKQALQIQPGNPEAKQMQGTLERAKLERPVEKKAAPTPSESVAKVEPAADVDVTYDTLVAFATKVQPILMNTCANCHTTERGGKFQLQRVSSLSQKAATEHNLAHVLTYLNMERPAISPLLVKAVQIHWKDQPKQPPIKDRQAAAFQSMQVWADQLIARNPHLRDYYAAKKTQEPRPSGAKSTYGTAEEKPATPAAKTEVRLVAASTAAAPAAASPAPNVQPMTATTQTSAVGAAEDWNDPGPFNRQYHPER